MSDLTVTWVTDSELPDDPPGDIACLGGWVDLHHRWVDYLRSRSPEIHPYLEVLRSSIIENNIRFTGDQHQHAENASPLFSDGWQGSFSYRAWGDLMACIWATEENTGYTYMSFYY